MISDFGYGNSYFFDYDSSDFFLAPAGTSNVSTYKGGWYSDWYDIIENAVGSPIANSGPSAWGNSVIRGSLILPKATLDHTYPLLDVLDLFKCSRRLT